MSVLIYVNASKQVGDVDHLKVFANADAAETWFEENDPERRRLRQRGPGMNRNGRRTMMCIILRRWRSFGTCSAGFDLSPISVSYSLRISSLTRNSPSSNES